MLSAQELHVTAHDGGLLIRLPAMLALLQQIKDDRLPF
jgi:hypothetical protein